MYIHKNRSYCKEPFDDYTHRARVAVEVTDVKNHHVVKREFKLDVYTTNPNQDEVKEVLWERSSENVTKLEIDWWSTREQDESNTKFIDELLNDNFLYDKKRKDEKET